MVEEYEQRHGKVSKGTTCDDDQPIEEAEIVEIVEDEPPAEEPAELAVVVSEIAAAI